nr:hypothetical protein [Pandoravirus aubagnensis]
MFPFFFLIVADAGHPGASHGIAIPREKRATCSAKHRDSFVVFWLPVTVYHAVVALHGCLVVCVTHSWSVAMLHRIARAKHGSLGGTASAAPQCPSLHVDVFLFRRGPMASSATAVKKGRPVLVFLIAIAPSKPATDTRSPTRTCSTPQSVVTFSIS